MCIIWCLAAASAWINASGSPVVPTSSCRSRRCSDRCRTLFRQALQKQRPEALPEIPVKAWQQRWVVHSAAVGSGQNALSYLSRYVFKTAAGNRSIQLLPDGQLRWPFRHSGTGAWQQIDLQPFEFLRRFLQHVLPSGFHRVRCFGWLHPGGRVKFNRVRALLKIPRRLSAAEQAAWQPSNLSPAIHTVLAPPAEAITSPPLPCPRCGKTLILMGRWRPGQNWRGSLPDHGLDVERTIRPP